MPTAASKERAHTQHHTDVVELLLSRAAGTNIDARDNAGQSALHHAAASGDARCVDLLWPRSDLDAADAAERSPLHLAATHPSGLAAATRLIIAGCDPSAPDATGFAAGHYAAYNGAGAKAGRVEQARLYMCNVPLLTQLL